MPSYQDEEESSFNSSGLLAGLSVIAALLLLCIGGIYALWHSIPTIYRFLSAHPRIVAYTALTVCGCGLVAMLWRIWPTRAKNTVSEFENTNFQELE